MLCLNFPDFDTPSPLTSDCWKRASSGGGGPGQPDCRWSTVVRWDTLDVSRGAHMRFTLPCVLIAACGFAVSEARAQLVPFFNANPTGFDPEISVVNSGELLDAQAVVSNDLK